MKRLTTNCPDNNLDAALNLFYIKDFETWVRGGGDGPDYPDIRLYDFIRKAAKILLPDLDFPMDDDGVDYAMGELLLDGPDEPTGLLALLYTAAWSYAELRGRLMQYEDTGLEPAMCANYKTFEDEAISKGVPFKRIVELMEADKAVGWWCCLCGQSSRRASEVCCISSRMEKLLRTRCAKRLSVWEATER